MLHKEIMVVRKEGDSPQNGAWATENKATADEPVVGNSADTAPATILAMAGCETERWYDEGNYGHAIPRELWAEWTKLWERIDELDRQFYEFPFVDHRVKRTWEELSPHERIMHTALRPMLSSYTNYIKFTRSVSE